MERKLTAILCADVCGYSRLMGDDEEATFRTLASRRALIDRLIEQYHGRFVNSAGDSVLAEFASVVNAVKCGIEIQAALKTENEGVPPARRMEFRIGINLGDVIVDGDQIYGDGVNVASRLESLSDPGGICISGIVHEQVRDKLALVYEDAGEQAVKNIARPVRVWRVLLDGAAPAPKKRTSARSYWRGGLLSAVGLAIIIGTIMLVQNVSLVPPRTTASIPLVQNPHPNNHPQGALTSPLPQQSGRETEGLALPDKPSIAVLPFINMSGDHEQEYFSDGITDDLITNLSRLPGLFVIARESSFTYKGKPAKLQDVSKELGVRYVLGGSVRKNAEQLRITVQLAEATTGAELWAERYDRPLRDVFTLQDEIVRRIVTTLNLQIALAEQGLMVPRTTENLEAYDYLLRGIEYQFRNSKDGNAKARPLFERAIKLDPGYAYAYAGLALNYFAGWALAFDPDPDGLKQALHLAQQAIALDDSLVLAHVVLAQIYSNQSQSDQALSESQRAIALDLNSAGAYSSLGDILNNQGKPAAALAAVEKAIRLDPRNSVNYLNTKGTAHTMLGQWKEAITAFKSHLDRFPDSIWSHAQLAIAYYNLGDLDAARAEIGEVERLAALTPNSAVGYSVLVYTLHDLGKPVETLAVAEKGIRLDPENRGLLFFLGAAYNELGRHEESLAALKRVPVGPLGFNDVWFYVVKAIDYDSLGQKDGARAEGAEVERIVAREPDSWEAYRALVVILSIEGKDAESLMALGKAMRLEPGNRVKCLLPQGIAYARLGRWEEAISALKDYLTHYPDQVMVHVELAVDYAEVGREDAARAEVAQALRLDPQLSLEIGARSVPLMDKDRVAGDLRKAGLT